LFSDVNRCKMEMVRYEDWFLKWIWWQLIFEFYEYHYIYSLNFDLEI
jgi:hypothetical protein